MEGKVIRFDKGEDRLIDLAERYCDEKNYCAALRMIYKKMDLYGAEAEDWMFLAETYDDMDAYDLSINCWFRFLAVCSPDAVADAYEGLGACYYNIGNEPQAAYYYNKLLEADPDIPPEGKMEIAEMFTRGERETRFKVIHPPERADYSEEVDKGVRLMRANKYDAALAEFKKVHPQSPLGGTAATYSAVVYMLKEDCKQAEKCCLEILERDPDDVQALSTYCAVLHELGEKDKMREIGLRMYGSATDEPEDLYKIATICSECGLHEEAYQTFCKLEQIVAYDQNMLYFKAAAACKCKRYKESAETLAKLLDINPRLEVARFAYQSVKQFLEGKLDKVKIGYLYKISPDEKEKRTQMLALLSGLDDKDLRDYTEQYNLLPLLRWCFDEFDGREPELQLIAVSLALRGNLRDFFEEVMLDATVNDVIKVEGLHHLFEKNKEAELPVVLYDRFKQIRFIPLKVGAKKRKAFVQAYVVAVVKFCVLDSGSVESYNRAARKIYRTLEEKNLLDVAKNEKVIGAVLHLSVAGKKGSIAKSANEFDADKEDVRALWKALKEEPERKETER